MTHTQGPFSTEQIAPIFHFQAEGSDKLKSRENSLLEFKESFNWANRFEYGRTIAAFANAKGGYLVFGVTNSPRRFKGLQSTNFENLDATKVSEFLNEYFSPEIHWEQVLHDINGKLAGIIYVYEAKTKPVVCSKNGGGTLAESAIYYRYRGRTTTIRFPELRAILDEQRKKDQDSILSHIKRISEIGVNNIGILDARTGLVEGARGNFIIDKSLLKKISFIKEGHFREDHGAPALKLVGNIQAIDPGFVQPVKRLITTRAIRTPDIVNGFLDNEDIDEPLEYIKQIAFEPSGFLPIYYYLNRSGKTLDEARVIIEGLNSRSGAKGTLLKRLGRSENLQRPLPSQAHRASNRKLEVVESIKARTAVVPTQEKDLLMFLVAVTMTGRPDLDYEFVRQLLKKAFDKHYTMSTRVAQEIRMAVCHLDLAFNYPALSKNT